MNLRREFFFANPEEVKEALMELRGDLLTFNEEAEALEWTQSEATLRRRAIEAGAEPGATAE